jgi:hypothetical protein
MSNSKTIDQQIAELEEKDRQRVLKEDSRQKEKGAASKIVAWIHLAKGGDDRCIDVYYKTKPSDAEIQAYLRGKGSSIDTDYQLVSL